MKREAASSSAYHLDEIYDDPQGERVPSHVPGTHSFHVEQVIRNTVIFKQELKNPYIREEVVRQHENGKVVAATHRAIEVILHVATKRSAIIAGSTALTGASAFYFFRKHHR